MPKKIQKSKVKIQKKKHLTAHTLNKVTKLQSTKHNPKPQALSSKLSFTTLAILSAFGLFLLFLPMIISYAIPCFHAALGSSFTYAECNSLLALDRFMWFAIGGMSGVILMVFFTQKGKKNWLSQLLIFGAIASIAVIISYYIYIPQAAHAADLAPVRIDSIPKP